ncbi:MAG: response regulator [Pedobacter sp.]|uniref:response regulator n=1 Tax=Pedobacter sp. TaxID=1411316 RepID=UPI0033926AF6
MKKYIHVVEDNEDIRYIVEFFLMDFDYEVQLSSNVKEFIASLKGPLPDLYLVDVMLPDGNGLEICNHIKSNEATKHIPVIIMSAHSNENEVRRESLADDFISKPFDLNDLVAAIEKQLQAKSHK